jgi:bla regulator protein blaR1
MGGGRVITDQMNMHDLAVHLSGQVTTSVTDKTGLTGVYKFRLEWTPERFRVPGIGVPPAGGEPGIDASGTSLFTALQEQLGLKLEPVKGSVAILVIDHVEKPDAN